MPINFPIFVRNDFGNSKPAPFVYTKVNDPRNVAQNGQAEETAASEWSVEGGVTATRTTTEKNSGTASWRVAGMTTSNGANFLRRDGTRYPLPNVGGALGLSNGARAQITFYIKGGGSDIVSASLESYDSGGTLITNYSYTDVPSSSWTQWTISGQMNYASATFRLRLKMGSGSQAANVYVDDIKLTYTSPTAAATNEVTYNRSGTAKTGGNVRVLIGDDFAHNNFTVPGGGPYSNIGGTPARDTGTVNGSDPASLLIATTGTNTEYVEYQCPTPELAALGWRGFFFRMNTGDEASNDQIIAQMWTVGFADAAKLLWDNGTGFQLNTSDQDFQSCAAALDTWHWVEQIFDVSGTTHTCHWRVNDVLQTPSSKTGLSATQVQFHELGFSGISTSQYRFSHSLVGKAFSTTGWLGRPSTAPEPYTDGMGASGTKSVTYTKTGTATSPFTASGGDATTLERTALAATGAYFGIDEYSTSSTAAALTDTKYVTKYLGGGTGFTHLWHRLQNIGGGSAPARGIIYNDSGGAPGSRVAVTTDVDYSSAFSEQWKSFPFASPVNLSFGTYWLGIHLGPGALDVYRTDNRPVASSAYNADGFANGAADPFGGSLTTPDSRFMVRLTGNGMVGSGTSEKIAGATTYTKTGAGAADFTASGADATTYVESGTALADAPDPLVLPILDNFNRANETPLSGGGNWLALGTAIRPLLVSNEVRYDPGNASYTRYTTTFGANQGITMRIPDTDANLYASLSLAIQNGNTDTWSGYVASFLDSEGTEVHVGRVDAGAGTTLGSRFMGGPFTADGDRISFTHHGGVLRLHVNGVVLLEANDSTYGSGQVGFASHSTHTMDDFAAGDTTGTGGFVGSGTDATTYSRAGAGISLRVASGADSFQPVESGTAQTGFLPFPQYATSVTDNFNRANETPISGNGWNGGTSTARIVSNRLATQAGGNYGNADRSTPLTNHETTYELYGLETDDESTWVAADTSMYGWVSQRSASAQFSTQRWLGSSYDITSTVTGPKLSDGDAVGYRMNGAKFEIWVRISGVWSKQAERTALFAGTAFNSIDLIDDDVDGTLVADNFSTASISGPLIGDGMKASGGDATTYVESGTAISARVASGADAVTSTEAGLAQTGNLPFPQYANTIVDNFNRADEDPVAGVYWDEGNSTARVVSNRLVKSAANGNGYAKGPFSLDDLEMVIEMYGGEDSDDVFFETIGVNQDLFAEVYRNSGSDTYYYLSVEDPLNTWQADGYFPHALNDGDAFAVRRTGNIAQLWVRRSGSWELILDMVIPVPPETADWALNIQDGDNDGTFGLDNFRIAVVTGPLVGDGMKASGTKSVTYNKSGLAQTGFLPFPQYAVSVTDNFNRTDETPISGNGWDGTESTSKIASNQLRPESVGDDGYAIRSSSVTFHEMMIEFPSIAEDDYAEWGDWDAPLALQFEFQNSLYFSITDFRTGTTTFPYTTIPELTDGDAIGVRAASNGLAQAWVRISGVWYLAADIYREPTPAVRPYLYMFDSDSGLALDNFSLAAISGGFYGNGMVASGDAAVVLNKSGTATSAFSASGADAFVAAETGAGIAPLVASGTDAFTTTETGTGIAPFTASGFASLNANTYTKSGLGVIGP